jgi:antirestriction protein ArdC
MHPKKKIRVANGELMVFEKTYLKPDTVFDISRTNVPQEDLPKFFGFMDEKPDSAMQCRCLSDIAEEHGIKIELKDLKSISLKGYYQPSDDVIALSDRLNDANMFKTVTHEFAHALLHKNSRDMPKPQVEFEAESVAYMVLRQVGADLSDYQFDYISQYFGEFRKLKDADFGASLKRVNNTAGYISGLYQQNIENYKNVQQSPEAEFQEIDPEDQNGIAVFKHLRKDNANEENPFV